MGDPGSFREIARTVRIEYPIPYLSVVLGALALASLGLTAFIPTTAAWAAGSIGVLAGLAAIGLPVWAVLHRPELLRSERHSLMSRAFDVMLDKGIDQEARLRAGQIVQGTLLADAYAERVPRPGAERRMTSGGEDGNERVND